MGRLNFKDHGQNRPLGLQPTPGNYEAGLALPTQGGHPALGLNRVWGAGSRSIWAQRPPDLSMAAEKWGWPGGLEVAPRWVLAGPQPGAESGGWLRGQPLRATGR